MRAERAVDDIMAFRFTRYPHFVWLPRIWQLRQNLSAHDAAYGSLAERLGPPLIMMYESSRIDSGLKIAQLPKLGIYKLHLVAHRG